MTHGQMQSSIQLNNKGTEMKYTIIKSGPITAYITHTYLVDAETEEEALDEFRRGKYEETNIEYDIDDDYSEVESITLIK